VTFTISAVSTETGIAKEVLRKWEIRYGFPVPERDQNGNRVYSFDQMQKLKQIKRLMDEGKRAGDVVPLDDARLSELLAQRLELGSGPGQQLADVPLIDWLRERDPGSLMGKLRAEIVRCGLEEFVMEQMPLMNKLVGQAWASGSIAIRDEHLYTETVQTLIREYLARAAQPAGGRPRVLLTTPTGELHTLGILMLETVLTLNNACCISLGAQSPLQEIVLATQEYDVQIVCLSFSASYPMRKIFPLLKELRSLLPAHVQLWAGGAGIAGLPKFPRGVAGRESMQEAVSAIEECRRKSLKSKH